MSLARLGLFLATCSWILDGIAGAQGNVLIVDNDGPNGQYASGAAWLFDLNPDGTLDSLSVLPTPDPVSREDHFGRSLTALGDLNGDGIPDLAVGATGDDRTGRDRGAVWLLFRDSGGGLQSRVPLRPGLAFPGAGFEPESTEFGAAVASLGDLGADGTLELAVGWPVPLVPGSPSVPGGVSILSLATDGTVVDLDELAVSGLTQGDAFGASLANLGDFDGDGVADLLVGSPFGAGGSIRLITLNANGTPKSVTHIGRFTSGFGDLVAGARFGWSVARVGDVNADGVTDIAVGSPGDLGFDGSVWVLFLNPDGTVQAYQRISNGYGGYNSFGASLSPLGDLDADGVPDIAVGAGGGSPNCCGEVFVLFLNPDGTVRSSRRLRSELPALETYDGFGASIASLGDWDSDGRPDFAVGLPGRDSGPTTGDYTSLEDALDAASSGDTILVRAGHHQLTQQLSQPYTIDAKSLTIQAWNPNNVTLQGSLKIRNLSSSQTVQLSGLRLVNDDADAPEPTLELEDNAGRVWIDDCHVISANHEERSGLRASNCSAVILNRTQVQGGRATSSRPGLPGLELDNGSTVHAYDCAFFGGAGHCTPSPATPDGVGGTGVRVLTPDDWLFLSSCTIQGEGAPCTSSCTWAGIALENSGQVIALDSVFRSGDDCTDPISGPLQLLSGQALSFLVNNPTRENEATQFAVQGPPGAAVIVRYSVSSAPAFRPAHNGSNLLGSPRIPDFIGVTDANGSLHWTEHLGLLPPGFEILRFYAQSLYTLPATPQAPSGAKTTVRPNPSPLRVQLGPGIALTRLDDGL